MPATLAYGVSSARLSPPAMEHLFTAFHGVRGKGAISRVLPLGRHLLCYCSLRHIAVRGTSRVTRRVTHTQRLLRLDAVDGHHALACHVEFGPGVAKCTHFLKGEVFFDNGKLSHF